MAAMGMRRQQIPGGEEIASAEAASASPDLQGGGAADAGGGQEMGQEAGDPNDIGGNPVVEAMQTLQVFAASLQERGDPRGQALRENLLGMISALQGGQEEVPEAPRKGDEMSPMDTEQPSVQPAQPRPAGVGAGVDVNKGKGIPVA